MNTNEDRKDAEAVATDATESKQPEQKKDDEIDLLPA